MTHDEIPSGKHIQLIQPTSQEVSNIIGEINHYLDIPVNESDVDAVWSGIRPLSCIPNDGYSQNVINGTVNFIQRNQTKKEKQNEIAENDEKMEKEKNTSNIS